MINAECEEIGFLIKQYRKSLNLSRAELSEKIHISEEYLRNIENGEPFSVTVIEGLYKTNIMDVDYLLTGKRHVDNPFIFLLENADFKTKKLFMKLVVSSMAEFVGNHREWGDSKVFKYVFILQVVEEVMNCGDNGWIENNLLRIIRHRLGYSHETMASYFEINSGQLKRLEQGKTKFKPDIYIKLWKVFGFNPRFVISGLAEEVSLIGIIWRQLSNHEKAMIIRILEAVFIMGDENESCNLQ